MTSAFHAFSRATSELFLGFAPESIEFSQESSSRSSSVESETEDEEIKLTCMGGLRGCDDSDIHSSCDFSCEESDGFESDTEVASPRNSPVVFISDLKYSKSKPVRPRAVLSNSLSSRTECEVGQNEADDDSILSEDILPIRRIGDSKNFFARADESDEGEKDDAGDDASSESSDLEDEESSCFSQDEHENVHRLLSPSSHASTFERQTFPVYVLSNIPSLPMKRTLSSTSLGSLLSHYSTNSHVSNQCSSKKRRLDVEPGQVLLPFMIGDDSLCDSPVMPNTALVPLLGVDILSSSDDDDEEVGLYGRLWDELDYNNECEGGDISPVPLLTPPSSPLVFVHEGEAVCEWPSGLHVDAAMTALTSTIHPLSPVSLTPSDDLLVSKHSFDNSSLTPLMRVMGVHRV